MRLKGVSKTDYTEDGRREAAMPNSNKERQALDRQRKKKAGLVVFSAWVTPKEKEQLRAYLDQLRKMRVVK